MRDKERETKKKGEGERAQVRGKEKQIARQNVTSRRGVCERVRVIHVSIKEM